MAMFDGLQNKLQEVFRNLRGEGRISEEVLSGALRQIRLALLEADVHIRVVKPFVERISWSPVFVTRKQPVPYVLFVMPTSNAKSDPTNLIMPMFTSIFDSGFSAN